MRAASRQVPKRPPRRQRGMLIAILRAYFIGHLVSTGPRLLNFAYCWRRLKDGGKSFARLRYLLLNSLRLNRFPAFSAILVGLYKVLHLVFSRVAGLYQLERPEFSVSFAAGFLASLCALPLLNLTGSTFICPDGAISSSTSPRSVNVADVSKSRSIDQLGGRTLDLTLLATVKAFETVIADLWRRHRNSMTDRSGSRLRVENAIARLADPAVFAASAGTVMWAWFYLPERLPAGYNRWIGKAAEVDDRLIGLLRDVREGNFVYGAAHTEPTRVLGMCQDYGWPEEWSDPSKTTPLPCEMVHMGVGPSCHYHAFSRFMRAFKFSLAMYLPLQLIFKNMKRPTLQVKSAFKDALRSSAFLGAFISMFYYSVCLARTLIGPKLFKDRRLGHQTLDSGLCVAVGCVTCGWSILLEAPNRRPELAYFVAPRAAATFLPRRYNVKHFWREQLAFALSTGILIAYAERYPSKVRGVLGSALRQALGSA